jgi:tetratricopeptide (TPR) repeat protein
MSTSTLQPQSWLDDRERFNQGTAILIAVVTLLAAFVGYLQNDASANDDLANRRAQRAAIQQVGQRISGEVIVNGGSDTYRHWDELATLAIAAEINEYDDEARRYYAVQEQMAALSPLLAPPYFNPLEDGGPDEARYEADTYLVRVTALSERFAASFVTKQAWNSKTNTYILHLTILAVSLFLFGLAMTIASRVRWIFSGTALFTSAVVLLWVGVVYAQPVADLADAAIESYAQGAGLAHQGRYEEAIAAYDKALAIAPDYGNALYDRGFTYYRLGEYEDAVADYLEAQAINKNDPNIAWDLGWSYYLLGHFDEAAVALRRALSISPDLVGARFDLALTLLAGNQIEAARAEYTLAMNMASQQVTTALAAGEQPPESLWLFMEYGSAGLIDLLDLLAGAPASDVEAPPRPAIVNPTVVQTTGQEMLYQIKSLTVALEFTGAPPTGQATAHISEFEFGQYLIDDEGDFLDEYELTDTFAFGTNEVLILFDYDGMQTGYSQIWKVFVDGEEDPSWRVEDVWELGPTGSAEKALSFAYSDVFVLPAGEYTVELYVNSWLAQSGRFVILDEE